MFTEGATKGFEVWIARADGTRFNEHKIKVIPATETEPTTTECWLESEDDQIRLAKTADCPAALFQGSWKCKTQVDGRVVERSALLAGALSDKAGRTWCNAAVMIDQTVQLCDLQFRAQDLTSDIQNVKIDAQNTNKVGLIEVHLLRGSWSKASVGLPCAWAAADQGPILEGKHKLGSKITAINPKPAKKVRKYKFKPYNSASHVHEHRFIFRYRNRAVLELMNIIESSAPPDVDQDRTRRNTSHTSSRKRKRSELDEPIDFSSEGAEIEQDHKPMEKMALQAKRIKYLESQLAQEKKRKATEAAAKLVVDLTQDYD